MATCSATALMLRLALRVLPSREAFAFSQIVYEQVLNKVSAKFRDIGLRTVKNMPSPIHVYAFEGATATLDRKSWSLMGGFRRRIPLTLAIGACLALSGLIMMVALNRGRFPSLGSGSATNDGTKAVASGLGIYGVIDKPLKGSPALTGLMLFKPEQTPFVSDSNRVRIAKDLTARGANSALAISIKGGFGAISDRSTPEIARNDAITLCNDSRLGECTIYELNGVISWPRPIPLPPKPWIDPTAVRKPFDATRLRAIKDTDVSRITQGYPHATLYKALALGPPGIWWYRSQRSDEEEATRVVLEQCGDDAGTACRVVAVNDEFVVDETTAPVDVLYDSVARCIGLAGASFDAGATSQGISLNEIDANSAIPACRSALAAHPSDTSLQLCLGRAIERVIFCRRRLSPSIKVPPMEAMVLRLTFLAWPTTVVNSVYRRSRPSPPRCIENLLTPVIQTAQKTWV